MKTTLLFATLPALALAAPASAQAVVDGTNVGDGYGSALAVQTVQTGFGDNASELNAAYGKVEGGRLYIALTGNIEDNFNKVEIFFDSVAGGENTLSGMPGNDGAGAMTGLTFDAGFDADYHIILRRGFDGSTDRFDVDYAILGTASSSFYGDVFGGFKEGAASTGTGVNGSAIGIAYDNSNVAGVMGDGSSAADPVAAAAVTTGIELSIDLADLGSPTGDVKVCAFVNNSAHDYASNQFLAGLTAPQGNLGSDGAGNFVGGMENFDLSTFSGDQFFTVPLSSNTGVERCFCDVANAPCGNPDATAGCANSTGPGAVIKATGSDSIALQGSDPLVLHVTQARPDKNYVVLQGGGASIQSAFKDGNLCVGNPTIRLPGFGCGAFPIGTLDSAGAISTDDGTYGFDIVAAALCKGDDIAAAVPTTREYQVWFRDGMGPCNTGSNLTNSVVISFVP